MQGGSVLFCPFQCVLCVCTSVMCIAVVKEWLFGNCLEKLPHAGSKLLAFFSLYKQMKSCCVALPHYRLDPSSYHRSGNVAASLVQMSEVPAGCLEDRSAA